MIQTRFLNLFAIVQLGLILLASGSTVPAQSGTTSPARGAKLGNAYAVGEFDTVNTTNGNLILNFPLAQLPAGRGSASAGVTLTYNSKLYNMRSDKRERPGEDLAYYDRTVIEPDLQKAGWRLSTGRYSLEQETRFGSYEPSCTGGLSELNQQIAYSQKLKIVFPDGSTHEMIPYGHKDSLGDRYFNVDLNGAVKSCSGMTSTSRPVYYSRDGSYLRLETTASSWTLYFSDGSRVENGTRIYDRNGNYVDVDVSLSVLAKDQFDRTITRTAEGDYTVITYKGVGGEDVKWKIKYKTIHVYKTYAACLGNHDCPDDGTFADFPRDALFASFEVVDEIVQPTQLGEGVYKFTYNGSDTSPTSLTYGWGELSKVELPSGAEVTYTYSMDGQDGPLMFENTKDILKNHVQRKTLKYDLEYDGQTAVNGGVENWGYSTGTEASTVTAPDGSVTETHFATTEPTSSGYLPWDTGLTRKTISRDGTVVENLWERNIPTGCHGTSTRSSYIVTEHADNPYIKATFTSIKVATSDAQTAIKAFSYDMNGNVTEVREYDFVPYSSLPRTNGHPTGLPSNADTYLKRVTKTDFHNPAPPTPTSSSTDFYDANIYIFAAGSKLLNLQKSVEVRETAAGQAKARSEMHYDFIDRSQQNTKAGNLTQSRAWDSAKGALNNPDQNGYRLDQYNSISTSATYNGYGMPETTTDANNIVTEITYGNVTVGSNSVTGPYPTQTVVAYGTSLARTSSAVYDFHTGVVTSATDEDNDLTVATEYDHLGRPVKVRNAFGTALESWTRTTYDDANRRIIVRSDLETLGDGKRVAIQHFDQLGRVRLSRTLEDASTEDPTNETDGIKVQTRYRFASGYTYQLQSNPYRAATSSAETDPTMGWTLSTAWSSGTRSEVQTFSGAALPAPWGSNQNSTGIVRTDIDANRTLVTDQAGKQRISRTNALGQLTDVWEVTPQDASTEAVTFASLLTGHAYRTSYAYDTLNNLTTVDQGSQTRTFAYSSLSRLTSATNPESGTIAYTYQNNGNLATKTDARGIVTTYSYDYLNRVTDRVYTNEPTGSETPDVEYTYGTAAPAIGKLIKVESSVSTTEYTSFDILGLVMASKQTTQGGDTGGYTTGYAYNLSGALVEQTYPSGRVVKNILDNNGDLATVQSKKNSNQAYWNYANHFTYNAAGAVTSMQIGNGTWESTTFNSRLQPTQIALGKTQNASNLLDLDFTYGTTDNNGNVVSQTITVNVGQVNGFTAVQNYSYDSLNRLEQTYERPDGWTETNCTGDPTKCWKQTFTFDRYGNRQFDEANTTMPISFANQAVTNPTISTSNNRINSTGYTFDAAGNTTREASDRKFTYDAENKQVKVESLSPGTNTVTGTIGEYFYDGDGKRVKKYVPPSGSDPGETTVFVYDAAGKLIAEYSTIVETTNAKVAYLTNDHLGSPRINTDANGAVTARHDYHPFGEEIATSQRTAGIGYSDDTVRKQFTGYERDNESDLDFAQARYFGSSLGRFTSPDPYNIILESRSERDEEKVRAKLNDYLGKPQQWNRYAYVSNNPLIYTDPTGEILELTGTDEERERAFKRLQELVGKDGELGLQTSGGRTFVTYNNKDKLIKSAGDVGQVVADIIASKTTVEFQVTTKSVVTNADGSTENINLRGGGVTSSVSGRIQIFVSATAGADFTFHAARKGLTAEDGTRLTGADSVSVAHELGHAWGMIKDNFTERYNKLSWYQSASHLYKENDQRSLQVENWQRDRLGLRRRTSH